MESRNPATGELLERFEQLDAAALELKLARAAAAFTHHRHSSFAQRALRLHAAADILEREKHELGRLMTLEMGKPLAAAIAEAEKCAATCRYYADNAARFLADERVDIGDGRSGFVRFQPMGVVLAVMPWNFPFWQVFRFAAPALMAGNVALLKHASNVPRCALTIEDVLRRSGFAADEFQALLVGSDVVDAIIRDDRVRAVTLTGSEGAGSAVARSAGAALKKTVLELGGSDPFIVMASADVAAAARVAVTARIINNGQSCIAAKRFIIAGAIYEEFRDEFVSRMRALRIGDPMHEQTQVGPLATESIRAELHGQVQQSVQAGARLITGGRMIDRAGWYYQPTVLEDVPRTARAFHEELFGPVACLYRVAGIDDAIRLANDSKFGLGSALWTEDEAERRRFIEDIEAGVAVVNGMVASDPRMPFGGVKASGYGRELGRYGLLEFVNMKSVVVEGGAAVEKASE